MFRLMQRWGFFSLLILSGWAPGHTPQACASDLAKLAQDPTEFSRWAAAEKLRAQNYLWENLSHPELEAGVVIASPSKKDPDYFYHWVRDAGLTMAPLLANPPDRWTDQERNQLRAYARFSQRLQKNSGPEKLGEPKYYFNGTPYAFDWLRPQDDGPAIRALSLIPLARELSRRGENTDWLYDGRLPTESVIKLDLEYTLHHAGQPTGDLWEETRGRSFYALTLQEAALQTGASFAQKRGDRGAAEAYLRKAQALKLELTGFWDERLGVFLPAKDVTQTPAGKTNQIDVATILGLLHATRFGGRAFLPITDSRWLATVDATIRSFQDLYAINRRFPELAPAIGRYPEDSYDGFETRRVGNPWSLATAAVAEFHYLLARAYAAQTFILIEERSRSFLEAVVGKALPNGVLVPRQPEYKEVLAALLKRGDSFLLRIARHAGENGRLAEQLNRETGFQQGAANLTWSYAALWTALHARERLTEDLKL